MSRGVKKASESRGSASKVEPTMRSSRRKTKRKRFRLIEGDDDDVIDDEAATK